MRWRVLALSGVALKMTKEIVSERILEPYTCEMCEAVEYGTEIPATHGEFWAAAPVGWLEDDSGNYVCSASCAEKYDDMERLMMGPVTELDGRH